MLFRSGVKYNELLEFPHGVIGLALNLKEDSVGAIVLGEYAEIKEGDEVKCTGRIVEVPAGDGMIGRVVNSLGQPIDGKGPIETSDFRRIEIKAPGIVARQPVKAPRLLRPTRDDLRYVGRFVDEMADKANGRVAQRLAALLTELHQGDPSLFEPQEKTAKLARQFDAAVTIAGATFSP